MKPVSVSAADCDCCDCTPCGTTLCRKPAVAGGAIANAEVDISAPSRPELRPGLPNLEDSKPPVLPIMPVLFIPRGVSPTGRSGELILGLASTFSVLVDSTTDS